MAKSRCLRGSPKLMADLWAELARQPAATPCGRDATVAFEKIATTGWGFHSDVLDVFWSLAPQSSFDFAHVFSLFADDVPSSRVCALPPGPGWAPTANPAFRVEDVAFLLIQAERLGLAIDPAPLVAALRPGLLGQAFVTTSEMAIIWYFEERHSDDSLRIVTTDPVAGARWFPEREITLVSATGYSVEGVWNPDEILLSIDVKPPNAKLEVTE